MAPAHDDRTCGNCGARVSGTAVTCPSCDALLAAYEAPAGSASTSDPVSGVTSGHVSTVPPPAPLVTPTVPSPEVPAGSVTMPTQHPEPRPFDAEAAIAEARRTLGMSPAPEPATKDDPSREFGRTPATQSTSEPVGAPKPGREIPSPSMPPVRTASPSRPTQAANPTARQRVSNGEAVAREVVAPETQPPVQASLSDHQPEPQTWAPIPTETSRPGVEIGQIIKYGVFLVFFLMIMGNSPFGISPFVIIVFAFIFLTNVLSRSAKAGGRKTTSMYDPNKRDPRQW